MTTMLSSKGQVVLPKGARHRLGLLPGARFTCRVREGEIVLTPEGSPPAKARMGRNPVSGLPVLVPRKGTPPLSSAHVRKLLADFP